MNNVYKIPLTNDPDQTFQATIPVNGKNLTLSFRVRYNTEQNLWWLSITDVRSKTLMIDALPILPGDIPAANILGQYQYMNIGSAAVIPTAQLSTFELDRPDDTTLGTKFWLVWGDNVT